MQIVIDIPEDEYNIIKKSNAPMTWVEHLIKNGTPLPKGHGRLIDESKVKKCGWNFIDHHAKTDAPTIIKADKEYVTRGNCMMCGKKLDEGLFFCKECEAKAFWDK